MSENFRSCTTLIWQRVAQVLRVADLVAFHRVPGQRQFGAMGRGRAIAGCYRIHS